MNQPLPFIYFMTQKRLLDFAKKIHALNDELQRKWGFTDKTAIDHVILARALQERLWSCPRIANVVFEQEKDRVRLYGIPFYIDYSGFIEAAELRDQQDKLVFIINEAGSIMRPKQGLDFISEMKLF